MFSCLLISLLVGIVATEGPRWCELPDSCQPGQLVPHPWDCHQYHLCAVGGVPHSTPLRCPHHHYFHPAWRRCLPEDTPCLPQCPRACPCHLLRQGRLVPHHHNCRPAQLLHVDTGHCLDTRCLNFCSDRAKVAPLATRNVTRVSSSVVVSDQCKFSCDGDFSKYADHYDCSLYYQCFSGGIIVPASCPEDLPYFDGEDCVTDNSVCCADLTTTTTTTTTLTSTTEIINRKASPKPVASSTEPVAATFELGESTTLPSTCNDTMICKYVGLFAMCTTCYPRYFRCTADDINNLAHVWTCDFNLVFNPVPSCPYCVLDTQCPYYNLCDVDSQIYLRD